MTTIALFQINEIMISRQCESSLQTDNPCILWYLIILAEVGVFVSPLGRREKEHTMPGKYSPANCDPTLPPPLTHEYKAGPDREMRVVK